jgi:hypothetical protein
MNSFRIESTEWPHWAVMWTMAAVVYAGCKWVTWRDAPIHGVPAWKQTAYLLAWPGLDAPSFLDEAQASTVSICRSGDWLGGIRNALCGVVLLFVIARLVPQQRAYVVGWVGMIGIVLTLHFGVFHLLSCVWRSKGVQARPLMNHPLGSTSLTDFWSRRWNTAFRDLTHRYLFRPCAAWLGPRWAIVIGFLFSGAVHDLVISIPSHGGYGGPTIFFAIQGAAMVIERSRLGRHIGLGSRWQGRLFAATCLIAPAGLLFHRPFVVGVIVPFMRAMGAI